MADQHSPAPSVASDFVDEIEEMSPRAPHPQGFIPEAILVRTRSGEGTSTSAAIPVAGTFRIDGEEELDAAVLGMHERQPDDIADLFQQCDNALLQIRQGERVLPVSNSAVRPQDHTVTVAMNLRDEGPPEPRGDEAHLRKKKKGKGMTSEGLTHHRTSKTLTKPKVQ